MKHSIGTLTVRDNHIMTKVNRNKRSYLMDNIHLVLPYPILTPSVYFVGDDAKKQTDDYISNLYGKFIVLSQEALAEKGLSLDDICTLVNYFINSPSLIELPNLEYSSEQDIRKLIDRLSEEGW